MWKQEVIKQFELNEKTIIALVKVIYDEGSISYDILKKDKLSINDNWKRIYPFTLNETDAENIYNLYKNKILDFSNEEYIKKLIGRIKELEGEQ